MENQQKAQQPKLQLKKRAIASRMNSGQPQAGNQGRTTQELTQTIIATY